MNPRENIIWDVILVIASVLVFRSMWTIMDRVAILANTIILLLLLCIGLVLTVMSLYKLTHSD